jgi:hypothetical protein
LMVMGLAALGDDAQAVVGKRAEAVGSPLDKFHFAVEAFGDAPSGPSSGRTAFAGLGNAGPNRSARHFAGG